jgi:hypothetical protein
MDRTIVFLLGYSLSSSIGLIWSLKNLWRAIQSQYWNRVDCEIIESRVTLFPYTWFYPIISYKYTIDGLHYKGKKIKYGGLQRSYFKANAYCEQYVKGEIYQVSVDPNNFKRSVLEPGASLQIYLAIIFWIVIGAIGFGGLLTY